MYQNYSIMISEIWNWETAGKPEFGFILYIKRKCMILYSALLLLRIASPAFVYSYCYCCPLHLLCKQQTVAKIRTTLQHWFINSSSSLRHHKSEITIYGTVWKSLPFGGHMLFAGKYGSTSRLMAVYSNWCIGLDF